MREIPTLGQAQPSECSTTKEVRWKVWVSCMHLSNGEVRNEHAATLSLQASNPERDARCTMYFFHANSFFAYFFYVDRRVIPRLRSASLAFHAHSIPRS